jgi:phosphoribosylformylglycinamidine (FGAM) synthase-like amidotransferase family enzyme
VTQILLCVDISTAHGGNDTHIWPRYIDNNPSPMENYRPNNGSQITLLGYVNEQGIVAIDMVGTYESVIQHTIAPPDIITASSRYMTD